MRLSGLIITLLSATFTLAVHAETTLDSYQTTNKKQVIAANAPPGLQKKGMSTIPSFLGNTPPGWDEGVKKGWDKNRDWRWDKKTKLWENKNWQWDNTTNSWMKTKGWKKNPHK